MQTTGKCMICGRIIPENKHICLTCERQNDMQTFKPEHTEIDRAAILRLCNEIEDFVSEISKLSENYHIYSDCKSILNRTKAIGKELTGDAGSKID